MSLVLEEVSLPEFRYRASNGLFKVVVFPVPSEYEPREVMTQTATRSDAGIRELNTLRSQWFCTIAWEGLQRDPPQGRGGMTEIREMWDAHKFGEPFYFVRHRELVDEYPSNSSPIYKNIWSSVTFTLPDQQFEAKLWRNAKDIYQVKLLLEEVIT